MGGKTARFANAIQSYMAAWARGIAARDGGWLGLTQRHMTDRPNAQEGEMQPALATSAGGRQSGVRIRPP